MLEKRTQVPQNYDQDPEKFIYCLEGVADVEIDQFTEVQKSEIFEDEEGFKFDELTRKMMTTARIIMEMATIISLIYKKEKINPLFKESEELTAIFFSARKTARNK